MGNALNGVGNTLNNTITANQTGSQLNGKEGNDTLIGGLGSDTLDGGLGVDVYVVNQRGGLDVITGYELQNDELRLSTTHDELKFSQIGLDLWVRSTGTQDQIRVVDYFKDEGQGNTTLGVISTTDGYRYGYQQVRDLTTVPSTMEADSIYIRSKDEYVDALSGHDLVVGYLGNDTIDGGEGHDSLIGGAGNDVLYGGHGDDRLYGEQGIDRLEGGDGDDYYFMDIGETTIISDINHTGFIDILGYSDEYNERSFDSFFRNADGNPWNYSLDDVERFSSLVGIVYELGSRTLTIQGIDTTTALVIADIDNQAPRASLGYTIDFKGQLVYQNGTSVRNEIYQLDQLIVRSAVVINGTENSESIYSLSDFDVLNHPANSIYAGFGNDTIYGGMGRDLIHGQAGDDIVYGGADHDTVFGNEGNDQLHGQDGNDSLTGGLGLDELLGGDGNDTLLGSEGEDHLDGGHGDDQLNGGFGADDMAGGDGDDIYYLDNINDQIIELADYYVTYHDDGYDWSYWQSTGNDTVLSTVDYQLADYLENLTLLGVANLSGTGNGLSNVIHGNDGDNQLSGQAGSDSLYGGQGNDTLQGGSADDNLYGEAGSDVLVGDNGNDQLNGGDGDDLMMGGNGYDIYYVDSSHDVVFELTADNARDTVYSTVDYALNSAVESLFLKDNYATQGVAANLSGTGNELHNIILGTAGNNTLSGQAGNDILDGSGGDDLLLGGAGNDVLTGGLDSLYVLADRETLTATLLGITSNNDTLDGGAGNDQLDGGTGNDIIQGGEGADTLYGGHDASQYVYYFDAETPYYFDTTPLSTNDDVLDGGMGNDSVDGGTGSDTLLGGEGDDYLYGGNAAESYYHYDQNNAEYILIEPMDNNHDYLDGGIGEDTLEGGVGDDTLIGGTGYDQLYGGEGNDLLDGVDDESIDLLIGGVDDDVYLIDGYMETTSTEHEDIFTDLGGSCGLGVGEVIAIEVAKINATTSDTVFEELGEGYDIVYSRVSLLLADNVEELHLVGSDDIDVIGGMDDNIIYGNMGNNLLSGGEGIDTLVGGDGNDAYFIDNLDDSILELWDEGRDTVVTTADGYQLGEHLENLYLSTDVITASGNALDNLILGNINNNRIYAESGDDRIRAAAGNDEVYGGLGDDTYIYYTGDGDDLVLDDGGQDILHLSQDIQQQDLKFTRDGDDLIVSFINMAGSIRLQGWLNAEQRIESLRFCGSAQVFDIATLIIDHPALVIQDDAQSLDEDTLLSVSGNVLANDMDPSGNTLTVTNVGRYSLTYGVLDIAADGSYQYTLNNNGVDAQALADNELVTDTIVLMISNSGTSAQRSQSLLTFNITGHNDAPVLSTDTAVLSEDEITASGNVLLNDRDVDHDSHLNIVNTGDLHGTYGVLHLNSDGSYVYQAAIENLQFLSQGQQVNDHFSVKVSDGVVSLTSSLAVTVTGLNDTTVTEDDTGSIKVGNAALTGNVLTNDHDVDQGTILQTVAATLQGQYGTLSLSTNGSYQYVLNQTQPALVALAEGDTLSESFGYTATDGITPVTGALTVSIIGRNDAPIVTADVATVGEDSNSVQGNVLTNDRDLDQGSVLSTAASTLQGLFGKLVLDTAGHYDYQLNKASVQYLGAGVTAVDNFTYQVSDSYTTTPSTLAITIVGANDAPVVIGSITNQTATVGQALHWVLPQINTLFNDIDAGDTLTTQLRLGNGTALPSWLQFDSATRTVSGTPPTGSGNLTLSLVATDTSGAKATLDFNLMIEAAPEAHGITLIGTNANDTLVGTAWNDILDGRGGSDLMSGGKGNDIYYVDTLATECNDEDNHANDECDDDHHSGSDHGDDEGDDCDEDRSSSHHNQQCDDDNHGRDNHRDSDDCDNSYSGSRHDNDDCHDDHQTTCNQSSGDQVNEGLNQGDDTVRSSVSYTLGNNLEALELLGSTALHGTGNTQNNRITGNTANNILDGKAGADLLEGLQGDDTYRVDNVGDVIVEAIGAGIDTVESSLSWLLADNLENLILTGSTKINATGNSLNNVLTGNSAANVLKGGLGHDTYVVGTGDTVTENANEGIDTIQSSISWTLGSHVENLSLTGTKAISATGNSLDNVLAGNSAANTLKGGAGNDTYIVGSGDTVTENANEGTDTVQSSVTWTLASNLENLTLTGAAAINGTGNALVNTLVGNSAANTLNGGAGADVLVGGQGNDVYVVDHSNDITMENLNDGLDMVQSSITWTLAANIENLTLTGSNAISGTGNSLDNLLVGNSAANTLKGGLGKDTYVVGSGDVVIENVNEGIDTIQSGISWTLGNHLENLTLTGTTATNGTGNTLANTLTGNCANNTLTGLAGNDSYLFKSGWGSDTIIDNDSTVNNLDIARFSDGINHDELWFKKSGNNLEVIHIGTTDKLVISNWYKGEANHVEQFKTDDNFTLDHSKVDQLVQAMSAMTPPSLGQTTLSRQQHRQLDAVIASSWG